MAVQTMTIPPVFVDNTEFHADPVRRVLSTLVHHKAGFFGDTGTLPTLYADYTVTVAPGMVALPAPSEDYRGVFLAEAESPVTLPIEPPHATQTRIDALIAYAVPPVGEGQGSWCIEVRTGTPNAEPVAPAVTGALYIFNIYVPAESSGEAPWGADMRQSNGQVFIAGASLASSERPFDVPTGTMWVDWNNGNVWSWEGSRWFPVGVPRFDSTAARDAAFDGVGEGQTAITRDPHTLWCYTGSSTGWQPVGDTVRAHHAFGASAAVPNQHVLTVLNQTGFAAGHNGGLVSVAGQAFRLNREGRWSVHISCYSDSSGTGLSTLKWEWDNGPLYNPDITNIQWRGGGFNGAGQLTQLISWTGNVTAAQAAAPCRILAGWISQTGGSINYGVVITAEYLGR